MQKPMKHSTVLTILVITMLGLSLSNCNKIIIPDEAVDMRKMNVPSQFNFEATTNLNISVILPTSVNYSERNKKIEILDAGPGQNGHVLNAGAANHEGIYHTTVSIPTQTDTLYVRSFAGWKILPLNTGMKSITDDYEANYDEDYGFDPPDSVPGPSPESKIGIIPLSKHLKSSINYVKNGDFELNNFGEQASWSSTMTLDKPWSVTNTIVGHTTLADIEGNKALQITNSTAGTIFGGITQMIKTEPGEEITFTADIKSISGSQNVWLYLIPRNSDQKSIQYYYISYPSPSSSWKSKTITATMPANTEYCQVLFWSHNLGSSVLQYDNAFVNIKGRVSDSDGDGVEDDEDAYPNDATKAFNNYYPSENVFGTLAFEDMWPNEGDYDFNDLVLGYQYNHVKNAQNEITSMLIHYKLRAIGASIHNGFGFQMHISPDKISQIQNDYRFSADNISIASNGTENEQDLATIVVFDDAYKLLIHSGEGLGINTSVDQSYVEPIDIHLQIDFTSGLSIADLGNAPNNSFLFRTNDRSWEVHLPGYKPTDLADAGKFGTGDDATNPANEYYYKTARGLPWGMNLPVTFVYPIEKVPINQGHLKFQQWATSGGYSFMDWYEGHDGYRDNSKLFIR